MVVYLLLEPSIMLKRIKIILKMTHKVFLNYLETDVSVRFGIAHSWSPNGQLWVIKVSVFMLMFIALGT